MNTGEVLKQLEFNRGVFPRAAVARAIALGPTICGDLISVLERTRADPDAVPRDFVQHIFALYLLAQFRERRAYDAVLDLFSLPEDTIDSLTGNVVTESLGRIVGSLAHGQDAPMRAMIEREDLGQYVRAAMLRGMACSCVQGELPRERFQAYLSELFGGRIRREHSALWEAIVGICLNLGMVDLRRDIERAFDDGLIDEFVIRRASAMRELSTPTAPLRASTSLRYSFILDTIAEMEWWACFRRNERGAAESASPSARRGTTKVGRNAPCPCGSGRKYKKCCFLAAGGTGA